MSTAAPPAPEQDVATATAGHRPSPRLRRFGAGMILRLAVREVRERQTTAAVAAVFGLVCGLALARAFDALVGHGSWPVAAIALLAGGAALADATDPGRREDAALLVRLGCPRRVVRAAGWAAAVAMVGLPAAIAAEVSDLVGASPSGGRGAWSSALLLVGLGAATSCGARLPASALPRHARRSGHLVRTGFGAACILLGAGVPGLSQTGGDLDLTLPVGTLLVIVGLVAWAPLIVRASATVAGRLRRPMASVAANSLREQRRGLTVSVAVVAAVAGVFVVQTVVGRGLGGREQDRREALAALGPTSTGGGEELLFVDPRSVDSYASLPEAGTVDQAAILESAGSDAIAAPIDRLQTRALPDGERYGWLAQPFGLFGETTGGFTARATPDLLRTLGLDPGLAAGDRALVLDDRVLDRDGRVLLVGPETSPPTNRRPHGVAVAGVDAVPGERWTGLPAVLLPDGLLDRLDGRGLGTTSAEPAPSSMVLRFPERPTAGQVDAVERAARVDVVRGDDDDDLPTAGRTDALGSIGVRTSRDARLLGLTLALLGLVALAGALAALRLAVRRDDALLVELGARRRTVVALAAVRASAVTGGATAVGAAIGLAATAIGLAQYDGRARVAEEVVLAPIGFHVPLETWIGLLLLPLAGAVLGAGLELLVPARRPARRGAADRWRGRRSDPEPAGCQQLGLSDV